MQKEMTVAIRFHYLTTPFFFPYRRQLKAFLLNQFKKRKKNVDSLNYIFCDDAYLLEVNRQYLNHDTYTDIITFELSAKGEPLVSDVFISVERVKENAISYGVSFSQELRRVIFHGSLHLLGLRDKTKNQAEQMRTAENDWLRLFDVSREMNSTQD